MRGSRKHQYFPNGMLLEILRVRGSHQALKRKNEAKLEFPELELPWEGMIGYFLETTQSSSRFALCLADFLYFFFGPCKHVIIMILTKIIGEK